MCVVCSGSVPHPSVQELPLYYSLIQLAVTMTLVYWFLFKIKLQKIYSDIASLVLKVKKGGKLNKLVFWYNLNMKKIILIVLTVIALFVAMVALAGIYKFNYIANKPGYSVDGNKISQPNSQEDVFTPNADQDSEPVEEGVAVDLGLDALIGMDTTQAFEFANQLATPIRIVSQDGEFFAVTADYRPGRINLIVVEDVVTEFTVE